MDHRYLVPAAQERSGHPIGASLGASEHERGQLVLLEQCEQERDLLLLAHEEDLLERAFRGAPDARHLDPHRLP